MQKNIIVKNLTLAETIAHRNPEVANELLIKNGYPHSPDRDVLAKNLNHFLLNQRDVALTKLAEIHPDKEIIMSANGGEDINEPYVNDNFDGEGQGVKRRKNKKPCKGCGQFHNADGDSEYSNCCGSSHADGGGEYSNCSGCGGSCGGKKRSQYSNAAGDNNMPALVSKQTLAIVGVIGIIMIGVIAISRPATK
jgi:hypothetical protein